MLPSLSRSGPWTQLPVRSRRLGPTDDQYDVLARWVAEVADPGDSLLDIGAGDGDDLYMPLIRPLVRRVVGVDPDPGAAGNARLDEWHEMTLEAFASRFASSSLARKRQVLPQAEDVSPPDGEAPFELALAVYVLEHVREPAGFFAAARACLRPGGSLFAITPNLWHYFGLVARVAMALGVEDQLLDRLLHGGHEHEHTHAAHFSVAYRANSVRALRRLGAGAGFARLEIAHLENPAVFETYFRGRAVAFPRLYSRAVHRLGRAELYGTLICRFVA